ncbi:MAG: spore germination protein [Clostridia bacterium]|nr:spore germination protein [Clostridia bacterium]
MNSFFENINIMNSRIHPEDSFDVIAREMRIGGCSAIFYYIDGFVKDGTMQRLMQYFIGLKDFDDTMTAEKFSLINLPYIEVDVIDNFEAAEFMVMSGGAVMFLETFGDKAIAIDLRSYPVRSMDEPENDRVMRGSRDGFVETLIFNTALIRRRIRDTSLTVKYINAGGAGKTDLALCYMKDRADEKYVAEITEKLKNINCDSLVMGHQSLAECLIKTKWYNPFPKIRSTERPDCAAAQLLEGSLILLCDNSPEAMILPTSIFDFLQETDDYYFPPLTGSYMRILRHFVFWLTMLITPLWYLALKYPSYLPEWLTFVIPPESGEIPIIVQLFMVEFVIDGLKLASLNTPSMLNNSLSIVGGLILGDFAVKAGWLIPEVILYMAFVAIANFSQPSYELGYAFKFMRMLLLLLTAIFGIWGFIAGIVTIIVLVASNNTVNGKRRYLYPLIPFNGKAMLRLVIRRKKIN